MCDVSGYTGTSPISIEQFGAVNSNRGPDGTTYYKSEQLNIAHSLLAIQPNKEQIQQPIVDDRTGNVLAYNGEIYGLGDDVFDSQWLSDCLNEGDWEQLKYRTNGMWGFAFYNRSKQRLTLCRDHFGVKPMYYATLGEQLFFSSHPRPIMMAMNTLGFGLEINKYRKNEWENNDRFPIGEGFPIQQIKRVPPGGRVEWCMRRNKLLGLNTLWGDWKVEPNYAWNRDEYHELMERAFKEVCYAPGVKKTISLSGGLDSTLIAGVAKANNIDDISATTLRFKKSLSKGVPAKKMNPKMYAEWGIAKKTAEELDIDFNWSYFDDTVREDSRKALGVPAWDRNRVDPRYCNIRKAAEKNNKIYLVGDGADELLTGYSADFTWVNDQERISLTLEKMHKMKRLNGVDLEGMSWYSRLFPGFERIFPKWHTNIKHDVVNNQRFFRTLCHVDGFMTVADHICGSFGMESRAPFLHQEFAKYVINIPGGAKLYTPGDPTLKAEGFPDDNYTYLGAYKSLIRDEAKKFIPDHVRKRGRKIGFANPINARDHGLNIKLGQEDFDNWLGDIWEEEFEI